MRESEIKQLKTIILQCPNRKEVDKLFIIMKPQAKQHSIHISEGTTYKNRYNTHLKNQKSTNNCNAEKKKTSDM